MQHSQDCAAITLFPSADSWYMGANVPGKPRVFLPYVGGVDAYRKACDEVVARGDLGCAAAARPAPAATTAWCASCSPTWAWCWTCWRR
jgi:hypothetical protein